MVGIELIFLVACGTIGRSRTVLRQKRLLCMRFARLLGRSCVDPAVVALGPLVSSLGGLVMLVFRACQKWPFFCFVGCWATVGFSLLPSVEYKHASLFLWSMLGFQTLPSSWRGGGVVGRVSSVSWCVLTILTKKNSTSSSFLFCASLAIWYITPQKKWDVFYLSQPRAI